MLVGYDAFLPEQHTLLGCGHARVHGSTWPLYISTFVPISPTSIRFATTLQASSCFTPWTATWRSTMLVSHISSGSTSGNVGINLPRPPRQPTRHPTHTTSLTSPLLSSSSISARVVIPDL